MKTNICTSREQSDRLLNCGVSADSADMCYYHVDDCLNNSDKPVYNTPKEQFDFLVGCGFGDYRIHITPAWSLSRLFELLPKSIISPMGNDYRLELSTSRMHDEWEVQWTYNCGRFHTYDNQRVFHKLWYASPIEACVKAIEWLTECGYQLNDIEKGGEDE